MSVLAAIAVLAVLVIVHEAGHFLAARWQNIHVNRFSIGFGPILWKYQGPETEYALRGIPLGGYVGFPDEDPQSTIPPDDPNLLRNRPVLDRAIVISAGVIANLIFAYFLLVSQVGLVGIPDFSYEPGVRVPGIVGDANSAATLAGIKANDIIVAVDGQTIPASPEGIKSLIATIQEHPDQVLEMEVLRADEKLRLNVTPTAGSDGKGRIGVQLTSNGKVIRRRTNNIVEAFSGGAKEFERIIILTAQGFYQLITNFGQTADKIAGPVAIVALGADIARSDASSLFQFAALISINLAIINILPLPALDGGQLAFLLIESILGKPLPTHVQENVMQTGLMLLLGLGVFLIIRDTVNLEWVQSLLTIINK